MTFTAFGNDINSFIDKLVYFIEELTYASQKKITEDKILSAAMQMLEEKGYDSINVKTLAVRLGCSTQPIYLSFRNMDDLRQAIANAAVREFVSFMHEDNEHAAHLYGMGYIRFAQEHANLFRFLFMRENAYTEMKNALSPIIETAVQNLMSEYGCSHEKAEWIHDQLWMHSHGIASMIAAGFCDWDMEKVSRMVKEAQDNVFQQ